MSFKTNFYRLAINSNTNMGIIDIPPANIAATMNLSFTNASANINTIYFTNVVNNASNTNTFSLYPGEAGIITLIWNGSQIRGGINGTNVAASGGSGSGTVTSVGLSGGTGLSVAGSPITTGGTMDITLANDLAAVEGISSTGLVRRTGAETWSAGTAVDLVNEVTGNLPVGNLNGGTNASSSTYWRGDGTWFTPSGSGSGTVTNVAVTGDVDGLTVSGSPITTGGTISILLTNDLAAIEALIDTGLIPVHRIGYMDY